ncbi:MAG: translocation/assembly module TamB domain-containing protein [Armatimonadota bacterium]|nr:translocation/assembly module TamB domain-containing protein [Armatimonadota bacterium]
MKGRSAVTIGVAVLCFLLGLLAYRLWRSVPDSETIGTLVTRWLSQRLGASVKTGPVTVGLLGVTVDGLSVLEDPLAPTGAPICIAKVSLRWSLKTVWSLLVGSSELNEGGLSVREVVLTSPEIYLHRDRNGRWNISPLLRLKRPKVRWDVRRLVVTKGIARVQDDLSLLPSGRSFQLVLENVEGEGRLHRGRLVLDLTGTVQMPPVPSDARAHLSLDLPLAPDGSGSQVNLRLLGLPIEGLPSSVRHWFGERLVVEAGLIQEGDLAYRANGREKSFRWRGDLNNLSVRIGGTNGRRLPSGSVRLFGHWSEGTGGRKGWSLTVEVPQGHPTVGTGRLVSGADLDGWHLSWEGDGFDLSLIKPFVSGWWVEGGKVSGKFRLSHRGRVWHISGKLLSRSVIPSQEVQDRFNIRIPFVPQVGWEGRLEGGGGDWTGEFVASANWNGRGIVAKGKVVHGKGQGTLVFRDFPFSPLQKIFHQGTARLDPPFQRLSVVDGRLSGTANVFWEGDSLSVTKARLSFARLVFRVPGLQLATVSFQGIGSERSGRLESVRIAVAGDEWVSGQVAWQRNGRDLFVVEAKSSEAGVRGIFNWLSDYFDWSLRLRGSGAGSLSALMSGRDWLVRSDWWGGVLTDRRRESRWSSRIGPVRLTADSGGVGVTGHTISATLPALNDGYISAVSAHLDNFFFYWDRRNGRLLVEAQALVSGFLRPVRKRFQVSGDVHAIFQMDGKEWKPELVRATAVRATIGRSYLSDGTFEWMPQKGEAKGSAVAKDLPLDEWAEGLRLQRWRVSGKSSGLVRLSYQVPVKETQRQGVLPASGSSLHLSFSGSIKDFFVSDASGRTGTIVGAAITVADSLLSLQHQGDDWAITAAQAEGNFSDVKWQGRAGKEIVVANGRAAAAASVGPEGTRWDLRIYQAKGSSFEWSASASGQDDQLKGHFSGSVQRIGDWAEWVGIEKESVANDFKVPMYLAVQFEGSLADRLNWKGTARLGMGQVKGWRVAAAGAVAEGTLENPLGKEPMIRGTIQSLECLTDLGEGVFSGTFTVPLTQTFVRNARLLVSGKWTRLPLARLTEGPDQQPLIRGSLSSTVKLNWDGRWRVKGVLSSPVIAYQRLPLQSVTAQWDWNGQDLVIQEGSGKAGDGKLMFSGRLSGDGEPTRHIEFSVTNFPVPLLATALPSSEDGRLGQWGGRVKGRGWVAGSKKQWTLAVVYEVSGLSDGVRTLGDGHGNVEATIVQRADGRWAGTVRGTASLKNGGSSLYAEGAYRTADRAWQVRWQAGRWSLGSLQSVVLNLNPSLKDDERFSGPISGHLWSQGEAQGQGPSIVTMEGSFESDLLRAGPLLPIQCRVFVTKDPKRWTVSIDLLRIGRGSVRGSGTLDQGGQVKGQVKFSYLDKECLDSLLRFANLEPLPVGKVVVSGDCDLSGTQDRLQVTGQLVAEGVAVGPVTLPVIRLARFHYREGFVEVPEGAGQVQLFPHGPVCQFWGRVQCTGAGELDLHAVMERAPLKEVDKETLPFQVTEPWVEGWFRIRGTVQRPDLRGKVLAGAKALIPVAVDGLPSLKDLSVEVEAEGTTLHLKKLQAAIGKGWLVGEGVYFLSPRGIREPLGNAGEVRLRVAKAPLALRGFSFLVREGSLRAVLEDRKITVEIQRVTSDQLSLTGSASWRVTGIEDINNLLNTGQFDVRLMLKEWSFKDKGISGKISGGIVLTTDQPGQMPTLRGQLTIADGNSSRLPSSFGLTTSVGDLRKDLPVDITVHIGRNFYLRTGLANLLMTGQIQLTGTLAQPQVSVALRSNRGTLKLATSVIAVNEMELVASSRMDPWKKRPETRARIRLEGETRLDIYQILITLSGPVDEESQRMGLLPTLSIVATPPLPEETILQRLFGIVLPEVNGAIGGGSETQQILSGTLVKGLTGELLAPVTRPIAEALKLTELSIVAPEKAERGWLRLGFSPSPRLHFLYRRGLSPSDPSALEVQYFVGKRTSVTWTREKHRSEVRIQTGIRF